MPRLTRTLPLLLLAPLLAFGLLSVVPGTATAHEERPAVFPDGGGTRPTFLGYDNPRQRVVCTSRSRDLVAAMPEGPAKDRSTRLLERCSLECFTHRLVVKGNRYVPGCDFVRRKEGKHAIDGGRTDRLVLRAC